MSTANAGYEDVLLNHELNPVPGALITVCLEGTTTPVALFDEGGTPIPNPVTTNGAGAFEFFAPGGSYTLRASGGSPPITPSTLDIWLPDVTGGGGAVTSVAGKTGDVVLVEGDIQNLTTDLAAKENVANKSTNTSLGTSDTLYPSQNAVKTYVDNSVASAGAIRTTASVTTASLAAGATENDPVTMAKSFTLVKLAVGGKKCRVRLYSTAAARTADASRPYTVPIRLGTQHGVICDFYFDQSIAVDPWMCSPTIDGSNMDGSPSTTIYAAITNMDSSSQAVTATLTYTPQEV